MIQTGVISISDSAFASPIIIVKKKDENGQITDKRIWRLVVDYRNLNLLTLKCWRYALEANI